MLAINVIREGDFIHLKTKEELEKRFGSSSSKCGCIGGLRFGEIDDDVDCLIISEFENNNLGEIVRVSKIIPSHEQGKFYIEIQANGLFDKNEIQCQMNVIQSELVKSVYLNNKWINSYEIIKF